MTIRYSAKHYEKGLLISFLLIFVTSCSWVSSRKSLFGSEDSEEEKANASIPKVQYDDLKKRYEELLHKKKVDNIQRPQAPNEMLNEMEKDPSQIVEDLAQVRDEELGSTVDVFNNSSSTSTLSESSLLNLPKSEMYTGAIIEDHISKLRKAEGHLSQNQLDRALTLFKSLANSPVKQIVVRAKFGIGEILFKQGEYDLAMQLYEEVINKYAFSGAVLKTLGRLIVCSEKLKINAKKEKYYSILHDFFEQGS